jgi:hypothetical protein
MPSQDSEKDRVDAADVKIADPSGSADVTEVWIEGVRYVRAERSGPDLASTASPPVDFVLPPMPCDGVFEAVIIDGHRYDIVDGQFVKRETRIGPDTPDNEMNALHEHIAAAWGIIANVSGGDWSKQTAEWQEAAQAWEKARDPYAGRVRKPPPESLNIMPTPMLLACPKCQMPHIDKSDPTKCKNCGGKHLNVSEASTCCDEPEPWTNPPHKTHRCEHCNHLWRPFDFPTYGVTIAELTSFFNGLSDSGWDQALSMANEMVNTPEAKTAATVAMLEADKFTKIGVQMNLWAKFLTEPADTVDHVRLCFIDPRGVQHGDSMPWDQFMKHVMNICGVAQQSSDLIIDAFRTGKNLCSVSFTPESVRMSDPQFEIQGSMFVSGYPELARARAEAQRQIAIDQEREPVEHPSQSRDPVHVDADGKWYFWEETWADKQGPFATEDEARTACTAYTRVLTGEDEAPEALHRNQNEEPGNPPHG